MIHLMGLSDRMRFALNWRETTVRNKCTRIYELCSHVAYKQTDFKLDEGAAVVQLDCIAEQVVIQNNNFDNLIKMHFVVQYPENVPIK